MKNKSWITGLFIVVLASIAIAVRIYYINNQVSEVEINEDVYNMAKVGLKTAGLTDSFGNGYTMQPLYIRTLSAAFFIFGNFAVAGVYLNMLYQVLTVLLAFAVVRNVSNRYAGFGAALIAAVIPIYANKLFEVTAWNMEIFTAAILCAVMTWGIRIMFNKRFRKNKAEDEEKLSSDVEMQEEETNSLWANPIKKSEPDDSKESKINYIENPLPVPKRKKHKKMDFALKTGNDDDFDLKDMTGKDFFDIE